MQAFKFPLLLLGQEGEVTGEACPFQGVWMSHASSFLSTRKTSLMGGFRRATGPELFACGGCRFESGGFFFPFFPALSFFDIEH